MKGTTEKVIYQKGGLLGTLLRFGLPLMKNVLTPLAKDFFLQLGATVAPSATNVAIQKNIYGSWMTTMIISNKEMEDIVKIVTYLEESGSLL